MGDISRETLIGLRRLEDDWNGYGEKALTEEALTALEAVHVSPCHDGGWQIEIFANGYETELRFGPDGRPMGVSLDDMSTTQKRSGTKRRRWPFKGTI